MQDDDGYGFRYDEEYLKCSTASLTSLTLRLKHAAYVSNAIITFFMALILKVASGYSNKELGN